MAEALHLGKVERQVVGLDPMQDLGLGAGDRLVGLRQLLDVVDAGRERVVVGQRGADAQHVQDHLRVLRIVLVPAVVQCLARAGQGHGRDQAHIEAGLAQAPSDGPVVVAGRLECAGDRPAEVEQQGDEPVVFLAGVQDRQPTPTLHTGDFDQHLVASFGDVDRHQNDAVRHRMQGGHGWFVSGMRLGTPSI